MFTLKKRVFSLLLVSVYGIAFNASAAFAETLEAAMQKALSYHPQVELAMARVEGAKEEEKSEFSGFFPDVNVNANTGRIYGNNSTSRGLTVTRGSAYSNTWEASVSARQPLFDGFETSSRVKAAANDKNSAQMSVLEVREQLAYRITQAYLAVMQARAGVVMLTQQQERVDDYLSRIKGAMEDGAADESEYQQARDVSVILDGYIADYKNELASAESQYFELTGEVPPAELESPGLDMGLIPPTIEEALSRSKSTHPSIRSASFQVESAGHEVKAEEGLLYPDIDGELSYLESEKKEELGGEVTDGRAIIRMSWNLETGGGQLARIRQKKYEYNEATARERQVKLEIERDLRVAYAAYENARHRLENQKEREDLNAKLFATYEAQFEGGRVNLLQLMQADNQLFNTKLETMTTQYRLMNAGFGILSGMGQLQASVLNETPRLEQTQETLANVQQD